MIAGMSGKLPESDNLQEFWANLIGGVDMVTDDDRRWKAGEWVALALPSRTGRPSPVLALDAASWLPRADQLQPEPQSQRQSHWSSRRGWGLRAHGRLRANPGRASARVTAELGDLLGEQIPGESRWAGTPSPTTRQPVPQSPSGYCQISSQALGKLV